MTIYKSYIEQSCSSFEIEANDEEKTQLSFYNYVAGGMESDNANFIITYIDPKIVLFNDNLKVTAGNTKYKNDDIFYFIPSFSDNSLLIKFKNTERDLIYQVIINKFFNHIRVKEKSYICIKSSNDTIINNMINNDLNKTFDINIASDVYFQAVFESKVKGKELIYKHYNILFSCVTTLFSNTKIECNLPIYFDLYPRNSQKWNYNIYSYLSCKNKIYIGTIIRKILIL